MVKLLLPPVDHCFLTLCLRHCDHLLCCHWLHCSLLSLAPTLPVDCWLEMFFYCHWNFSSCLLSPYCPCGFHCLCSFYCCWLIVTFLKYLFAVVVMVCCTVLMLKLSLLWLDDVVAIAAGCPLIVACFWLFWVASAKAHDAASWLLSVHGGKHPC